MSSSSIDKFGEEIKATDGTTIGRNIPNNNWRIEDWAHRKDDNSHYTTPPARGNLAVYGEEDVIPTALRLTQVPLVEGGGSCFCIETNQ